MENNNTETREYSEEEIAGIITSVSSSVAPSEAALRSFLQKMPDGVPSPYAPVKSPFSGFRKFALMALLLVAIIGGGSLYTFRANSPATVSLEIPSNTNSQTAAGTNGTDGASGSPNAQSLAMATPEPAAPQISNDDSDAALAQDADTVASQMSQLDSDNSNVDQAL